MVLFVAARSDIVGSRRASQGRVEIVEVLLRSRRRSTRHGERPLPARDGASAGGETEQQRQRPSGGHASAESAIGVSETSRIGGPHQGHAPSRHSGRADEPRALHRFGRRDAGLRGPRCWRRVPSHFRATMQTPGPYSSSRDRPRRPRRSLRPPPRRKSSPPNRSRVASS
jgi:hypothetical protein